MKFVLNRSILTKRPDTSGNFVTWVEPGEYNIVRLFDNNRVLIDVGISGRRQLTIIPLSKGLLIT